MPQAGRQNTDKPSPTQIATRGYVVDEAQDFALRDVANAMEALALICDEAGDRFPEMPGEYVASLFRTFGRQVEQVRSSAPFTNHCDAHPRDLH